MPHRFGNLIDLASRFGWPQALTVVALWTARQTVGYRRALIYSLDLDRIPSLPGCDPIEWRYISRAEVSPALMPPSDPRSADDQRYFVGMLEGEQCYASAVSDRGFHVPHRVSVTLPSPADAYVGDCFTLDTRRGRGIYPCGLTALGRALRADGKTRLYLFVERENLASIRSVVKAGFRPVAVCSVWRIAGRSRSGWQFLRTDAATNDRQLIVEALPA